MNTEVYKREQSSRVPSSVHQNNVAAADHSDTINTPTSNYPGPIGQARSFIPPGFANTPSSQQPQVSYRAQEDNRQAWLYSFNRSIEYCTGQASSFNNSGFGYTLGQNDNQRNQELHSQAGSFSSQQGNIKNSFGYAKKASRERSHGFGSIGRHRRGTILQVPRPHKRGNKAKATLQLYKILHRRV